MRTVLSAVVVVMFAGFTSAQDKQDEKIDAKKLLGQWQVMPDKAVVTFGENGKLTINPGTDTSKTIDGTYKIEGNKIQVVVGAPGNDKKETLTVVKLTDEELVTKDTKGKEDKFVRLKPKK
ncbi:MAG: TIGR03066 family protein [Gemmataceae bacterium]